MARTDRQAWTKIYWSDVFDDSAFQALSFDEQGRYWRVMGMLYRHDTPGVATESEIRAWACLSPAEWTDHRDAFARCFRVAGGTWKQERIVREMEGRRKTSQVNSENGRKGAGVTNGKIDESAANADDSPPVSPTVLPTHSPPVSPPQKNAPEISRSPEIPDTQKTPEDSPPPLRVPSRALRAGSEP